MTDQSLLMLESLASAGLAAARSSRVEEDFEIIRPITELDIPIVLTELREHNWSRASGPGGATDLRTLRTGHHQLAQLLGSGVSDVDASFITGRSVGNIRSLQGDPAFRELLAYYAEQHEGRTLNIYDRLTTIGAMASEILQERLEESPEKFSNGELRTLLELGTKQPEAGRDTGRTGGVNVQINFVKGSREGNEIEGTSTVIEETGNAQYSPQIEERKE